MSKYRYELSIHKGDNLINTIQLFDDREEQEMFTRFVKNNYENKAFSKSVEFDVLLDSNLLNTLFKTVDNMSLGYCVWYSTDHVYKELLGIHQMNGFNIFADATTMYAPTINLIFQSAILKNFLIETDGVLVVPGEGFFIAFGHSVRFSCKKVG